VVIASSTRNSSPAQGRKPDRSFADGLPYRSAGGKVVGASKVARDVSERKRIEAQLSVLRREAEHRGKNLLANVKAIVRLSQSDTPEGLKEAIEGRIDALANVHSLFVQSLGQEPS
jgi:hypothetical protein